MSEIPAASEASTELVLDAASFTGPERRDVQQRFAIPFGDLLTYTFDAMIAGARADAAPLAPLVDPRDGALHFPDDVVQYMLYVQARRTDPAATVEQFDHLTLRDLANARARGIPKPAAPAGNRRSPTSPNGSGSAGSSRASRGRNPTGSRGKSGGS